MQYCPETIIVHSAFSHVKRQLHNRSRSLRDLTKRECISSACETVSVVSGAIREATRGLEYRQSSDSPLFPYEISNLNYKLNAWIFKTWQRYREKSSGDRCVQHSKTQNDYFSCFPPLPHFNTAVYLSLVKDLGWSKIMIECLDTSAGHNLGVLLKDLIDTLINDMDEKDVSIFVQLFHAFIGYDCDSQAMLSVNSSTDFDFDCGIDEMLLQGLNSVTCKKVLVNTRDQETITKTLMKCVIAKVFHIKHSYVSHMFESVDTVTTKMPSNGFGLNEDGSTDDLFMNDFLFSHLDTKSSNDLDQIIGLLSNSQTEHTKELPQNVHSMTAMRGFSKAFTSYLKKLCDIFKSDWEICSRKFAANNCRHDHSFTKEDKESEQAISNTDHTSYHPLHKWLVGLLGALLIVIKNAKQVNIAQILVGEDRIELSLPADKTRMPVAEADSFKGLPVATNRTLLSVAETLCDIVKACVLANLNLEEQEWIGKLEKGETVALMTVFARRVHASEKEFVKELLSSQGDIEKKLNNVSWRIDEKLEGYEECFDWLLTAEELYSNPIWLECIEHNSVSIAQKVHLSKMVDIMCVLQEVLANEEVEEPIRSFAAIKQTILEVYSSLNLLEQEEIIEYSFNMSRLHAKSEPGHEGSVFFHPNAREKDFSDFHCQLVSLFNRIVDSSNKKEIFANVTEISKMALVSPYLTISRAVREAVVNSGHTKIICKILQQLPITCKLQFRSQPSETLLCHAVKTATSCVTTQQEERSYLQLVAILLKPLKPSVWAASSLQQPPLLPKQELLERYILPHLHQHGSKEAISKALAIKVLDIVVTAVNQSQDLSFLKKHMLTLLLSLCELLEECKLLWDGLTPDISLADAEEERELVVEVLEKSLALTRGVLQTYPSFARAVEWLLRRTEELDWTIPLHLYSLYQCCDISSYTFSIPDSLLNLCELSAARWTSFVSGYGPDNTMVVLFECCRVSDSLMEEFSAALSLEKLKTLPEVEGQVVSALAQVLTHSSRAEWGRILNICQVLLQMETVKDETVQVLMQPYLSLPGDSTSQLRFDNEKWLRVVKVSCILVKVMKTLSSPCCASWATPHMWVHVTKHYVASVKSLCDELSRESHHTPTMEMSAISVIFVHVCDVMTHTSAVSEQLFVLALDVANKVSSIPDYTTEQNQAVVAWMHEAALQIPLEVYREALLQTLT